MEELIRALELGKPSFDGEDTNYDVTTIENAITAVKKYAKIKKIVDDWNTSDIVGDEQDISRYFQQILDVFSKADHI